MAQAHDACKALPYEALRARFEGHDVPQPQSRPCNQPLQMLSSELFASPFYHIARIDLRSAGK